MPIEEGHLLPDHVHMLISVPPKYSVAAVIGYLKGKSSIWIAQNVERKARNFLGHKFWARGYFVSTVGRNEETIRTYIKNHRGLIGTVDAINGVAEINRTGAQRCIEDGSPIFSQASQQLISTLAIPSFFEIKESGGVRNLSEKNRICFFEACADCKLERSKRTRESPIQIT
jgi:REP-associated tyrosine transposase